MKLYRKFEQHTDVRGIIKDMLPAGVTIQTIQYITGQRGALRGRHYHQKDSHYCYVLEGKIKYTWIGIDDHIKHSILLKHGDCIFSETGEWHEFEFVTDGKFINMATEARTNENYEHDTIRHYP